MQTFKNLMFTLLILSFGMSTINAGEPVQVYFTDFEIPSSWQLNPFGTDDATTGQWGPVMPEETSYDGTIYQLGTPQSGQFAMVTGGLAGSGVGSYDIDDGKTSVRSQKITLPEYETLTLSLYYYFAYYSNSSSEDYLRITLIDTATHNTLYEVLNIVGAAAIQGAVWTNQTVDISSCAGKTVYILVEAADYGGGSLLEAGIDDVLIEGEGSDRERDSLALVAFYNSTGGPSWDKKDNWLTDNPIDVWYGVTVSTDGLVQTLDLFDNWLSGTLPPELGNLTGLQILYLAGNKLSGTLPSELWSLTNLQNLSLTENQFSGTLPLELGNLTNLKTLDLGINMFTGTIPSVLGNLQNLQNLSLSRNQLTGNIPPELVNLTNLQSLSLYDNQLTGTLLPELGNLTNLQHLFLNGNQFTGTLPAEFGNLNNLQYLSLSYNQLTGSVPSSFGNLVNLIRFKISNNEFSDLPLEITNLTGLVECYIGYNQFCTLSSEVVAWANTNDPNWFGTQDCPTPEVEITASPQSGATPLTVSFTATNIGQSNINSWDWSFGDGGQSKDQNPTYTYSSGGTFTAQLSAGGIGGSTTESVIIQVVDPPDITISASPKSGSAPLEVQFSATSNGGAVDTWHWDFGDGNTSNVQNPLLHTYTSIGTYSVILTATNIAGSSKDTVFIEALPPTAILSMTVSGKGSISPSIGDTQVVIGENVPLSATPDEGYQFVQWSVTSGIATIADPYLSITTAQLSENATINAEFRIKEYTLTVSNDGNGTTDPAGDITMQHGVPLSVRAMPLDGYRFALWEIISGTAIIENAALPETQITLEDGDAQIKATFVEIGNITPYNKMLTITGTIVDENGNPLGTPDPENIDASIRLTTDSKWGDTVYTETFYESNNQAVIVDNGLFVARLGSGTSTTDLQTILTTYENLFIEITIETIEPDVLLPRTPLTATAYTLTGPSATEKYLNSIKGSGNPNNGNVVGRIGMYYVDEENGSTWLRVHSGWILLD